MTLKFLDPFGSGKLVLFQVTYDRVCFRLGYLDPSLIFESGLARVRIGTVLVSRRNWGRWTHLLPQKPSHQSSRAFTAHGSPN